jgi:hypothetical protein
VNVPSKKVSNTAKLVELIGEIGISTVTVGKIFLSETDKMNG